MGKAILVNRKDKVKTQNSRVVKSIIWNGLASGLNLLLGMMITPLVTNNVGPEAYGYISLASNFIMYVTILTTALNSYATRYISIEYHKGNQDRANVYFNSVLFTNLVGGIFIFIVLMGLVFKLEYILVIPDALVTDVKILFLFMFLNFLAVLIGNTFLASVYVKNRLDLSGAFRSCSYIVQITLLILCFKKYKPHLWYVGLSYFAFSIIILLSSYGLYRKLTPELPIDRKVYSFKAVQTLVVNGIWNSINALGNTLNSGLDLIITNLMLTPIVMSQISVAKTIGGIVCVLYQLVSQVFQPQLLRTYAEGNKKRLIEQLQTSMKVSGWISGLFFVGFVVLGESFYKLWIPAQNTEYVYRLTIITLLSYVLEGIVGPLYYIYTLTVKNKIPCIITVSGGILNVLAMFLLLKYTNWGGYVVVGTTTVIMLFINIVTNPLYMSYCLKVKWYSFYPTIGRYIVFNFIAIVLLKMILYKIIEVSWGSFVFCGICLCIMGSVLYFCIMLSRKEKILLINKYIRRK